jgi:hypothetical protein
LGSSLNAGWTGEWSIQVQDQGIDALVENVSRLILKAQISSMKARRDDFLSATEELNDQIEVLRVMVRRALGEQRSD